MLLNLGKSSAVSSPLLRRSFLDDNFRLRGLLRIWLALTFLRNEGLETLCFFPWCSIVKHGTAF